MGRKGIVRYRKGEQGTKLGGLYRGKGWDGRGRKEEEKEGRKEGGRR
jgi:hypothetical protein